VIGPWIVIVTKDLWQPHPFAATFVAQSARRRWPVWC
jgi:hypothetical protein